MTDPLMKESFQYGIFFLRRSDQKSKEISLVKGNLYYLEGIFVEFGGGDHLSVAVDLPSGTTLKPIPSYYLRAKG